MILPYNVDVPMRRYPIANWLLIAATLVIGGLFIVNPNVSAGRLVLMRGNGFEPVQLIGCLFGHAGWMHLLGNMYFLFVFGNAVNARVGQVPYLLLYLAVGTIEGLVWLWIGEGHATLGASGAIMGIIGAFVVLYPRNDVSVFIWMFGYYAETFEVSAYWIVLLYFAFDVWGMTAGSADAVNYLAHVAGLLAGFVILMTMCAIRVVKPHPAEQSLVDMVRGGSRRE